MLLGAAAGVVGTILFAAYREEKFGRIVKKTQDAGEKSGEYLHDLSYRARNSADHAVEAAVNGVERIGSKVRNAVGVATNKAEETANNMGDTAHRALKP